MTAKSERRHKELCSWDAERAVLGGLMLWPEEIGRVSASLRAEDFHRPSHQNIYRLIIELSERGPIDPGVVLEACVDRWDGDPLPFGGPAYLVAMPQYCPAVEALPSYCKVVANYAARRTLKEAATAIREVALLGGAEADMLERVEAIVAQARRPGASSSGPRPLGELAAREADDIVRRFHAPQDAAGIPTGFVDLDRMFAINRTDFVIVGARPATGKTAMSLNLLANLALHVPSVFFSLEMSSGQLVRRMLARMTGVGTREMQTGRMDPRAVGRIEDAARKLGDLSVWIDDTPGLHIGQLRARVRAIKARCPELGAVFLDYIQLCQSGNARGNRQEAVSEISRGLKVVAKEFDVAVVGLSQLNRDLEKRDGQRPRVSDLRESGSLEQDTDGILLMHRDEIYNPDTRDKGICEIIIGKQRSGNIGTVKLAWDPVRQEFRNLDDRHNEPTRFRPTVVESYDDDDDRTRW